MKEEHKYNFCITMPDNFSKANSKASTHLGVGCQAVLMNFGSGYNDTQMKYYLKKFTDAGKAIILKPKKLRRTRVFAGKPKPPDPRLNPMQRNCNLPFGGDGSIPMGPIPGGADACE